MMEAPKKRGRPRSFDPEDVLARATDTFLRFGYAGASLETLTSAMGLNKPSLYAAFGDKHSLFMQVMRRRVELMATRYKAAFERGDSLETSLRAMLEEAVDINLGDESQGCIVVNVSTTEALVDEEFAEFTRDFFAACDRTVAKWIETRYAPRGGVGAKAVSQILNGVIHDISLRARVGEPKAKLREYARTTAQALSTAAGVCPASQ